MRTAWTPPPERSPLAAKCSPGFRRRLSLSSGARKALGPGLHERGRTAVAGRRSAAQYSAACLPISSRLPSRQGPGTEGPHVRLLGRTRHAEGPWSAIAGCLAGSLRDSRVIRDALATDLSAAPRTLCTASLVIVSLEAKETDPVRRKAMRCRGMAIDRKCYNIEEECVDSRGARDCARPDGI